MAELRGVDVSSLISLEQLENDRISIERLFDEYSDSDKKQRIARQPEMVRATMAVAYGRTDNIAARKRVAGLFDSPEDYIAWVKEHPTVVQLVLHIKCSVDEGYALLRGVLKDHPEMETLLKPKGNRFSKGTEHFGWVKASSSQSREVGVESLFG